MSHCHSVTLIPILKCRKIVENDPGFKYLDSHQNLINSSFGHALSLQKMSSESIHNLSERFCQHTNKETDTYRQTDRHIDTQKIVHHLPGGGKQNTLVLSMKTLCKFTPIIILDGIIQNHLSHDFLQSA